MAQQFSTSQYISFNRPNFFEIMAQDRLMPSLKFAFKYVLTIMTQRNPTSSWMRLLHYNDELFCGIQAFFEHHFLMNYNASFAEHLYGLKRCIETKKDGSQVITSNMTKFQKYFSLFNVVLVPYMKNKLDHIHRKSRRNVHDNSNDHSNGSDRFHTTIEKLLHQMSRIFNVTWPYLSAVYEGTFFVYILLYLFKDIKYHSPLLHLQGLTLKRVTITDLVKDRRDMMISRLKTLSYFQMKGGIWNLMTYVIRLLYSISDYSTYFLLITAFLFKFFEWWYASENQVKPKAATHVPPPPSAPKRASGGVELPNDIELCPICKKKRKNPTLLSMSGYVFCYSCIHKYVTTNSCCPVTRVAPVTLNHLRRLYEM